MARLRRPSFLIPVMAAFLLGVAGMYVLNPPAVSAQRTSLGSLEAAINDLKARMDDVEAGYFDGDVNALGDIAAAGNLAAGGGVQVGSTSVPADGATVGMLRWNGTLGELEVSDGTSWGPVGPDLGSEPSVQRDFITWNTTVNGNQPVYIKTNIPNQSNIMYRIAVEGYAYGGAQIINSVAAGFTYSNQSGIINSTATNYSSGVTISQYISSDGFVVIKLDPSNTFYMGFSASAWFVNPAGDGFQISAQVLHQVPAP